MWLEMWHFCEVHFAKDHPTASGHFPGNPIIPGALLLDEIIKAVAEPNSDESEILIRATKFLRPVRPGDTVRLRWEPQLDAAIRFECRLAADDVLAVTGVLEIGRVP